MALKCRMRLVDLRGNMNLLPPNLDLKPTQRDAMLLYLDFEGESTQNLTEIDALTNQLQVSTAVAIEIVSASATDKNAADGAVRSANVIGVGSDNRPVNNTEVLDAADGTTPVTTTNTYKDVWHSFSNLWGSADKDAEGNIDIRKANDDVMSQIAATANEGSGSAFMLPTGWNAYLLQGILEAVGAQAADEGKVLTIKYYDTVDALSDVYSINYETHTIYGAVRRIEFKGGKVHAAGTELNFFIQRVDDGNENFEAHLVFLLWKT